MAAAKAEAAHNRRHYRAAMLELCEIKKDLQAKEELVQALQKEAQKLQYVEPSEHRLMYMSLHLNVNCTTILLLLCTLLSLI